MQAYGVPDAGSLIKLDANENPFPWPTEIVHAWLEVLRTVQINRYPEANPVRLKERLCETMGIPEGMDVLFGNGSDELIQIILLALARPGSSVLAPRPTFSMYEIIAKSVGMRFFDVPLTESFALDVPAFSRAIETYQPAVTFLAYPNTPTGNLFADEEIEAILRRSEGLVVIDEAYFIFTDGTFLPRLRQFDNLLILRSFSKLGLAGLRLGFLVGNRAWLAEFDKVRLPYNINSLTQASTQFALANKQIFDEQVSRIRAERERLYQVLDDMPGVRVWPSEANFILFQLQQTDARRVYDALYAAGVLVKNLEGASGVPPNCLRVTVGTEDENTSFLQALRRSM
jgi:histidinol-phosphate aminotransferase